MEEEGESVGKFARPDGESLEPRQIRKAVKHIQVQIDDLRENVDEEEIPYVFDEICASYNSLDDALRYLED